MVPEVAHLVGLAGLEGTEQGEGHGDGAGLTAEIGDGEGDAAIGKVLLHDEAVGGVDDGFAGLSEGVLVDGDEFAVEDDVEVLAVVGVGDWLARAAVGQSVEVGDVAGEGEG